MKLEVTLILGILIGTNACSKPKGEGDHTDKAIWSLNVFGDNPKTLAPYDYVKWVKDEKHGFKKEKKIDDILFSVQYKPINYIICLEEGKNTIDDSVVKTKTKELDNMQYIDFKISIPSEQGEILKYKLNATSNYQDRVNYFAYKMQQDIQLVEGSDTIPCSLYHFERAYDVAPLSTFVLGFPLDKTYKGNRTFIYHDKIFQKGIIQFEFQEQDFQSIPKLETNEK
jgi:hypothetical protein